MLVDALTYRAVTQEIQAELAGARIDRIISLTRDSILITAGRGGCRPLLISASPVSGRICLVEHAPAGLPEPTPFVMLARKHFTGGRIIGVEQLGLDRIVVLRLEGWADQGPDDNKQLIVEIMGRGSNMILADMNGQIIEAVRHMQGDSSRREIVPGAVYEPPGTQGKPEPWNLGEVEFRAALKRVAAQRRARGRSVGTADVLSGAIAGIGPALAGQILGMAGVDAGADMSDRPGDESATDALLVRLWSVFREFAQAAASGRFTHEAAFERVGCSGEEAPLACSSWGIRAAQGHDDGTYGAPGRRRIEVRRFDSACRMLETCFGAAEKAEIMGARGRALRREVVASLDKARRRAQAQARDLELAREDLGLKRWGDLLVANLHSFGSGPLRTDYVIAVDYYDEAMPEVSVPVDPGLSAAENAQRFFKGYTRANRAQKAIAENIEVSESDAAYLESVLAMVDTADSTDELDAIRAELEVLGYMKPNRGGAGKRSREGQTHAPTRFTASTGHDILVGRNNLQNDQLTLGIARGHDLWFHVKDAPGSHVVLRKSARETLPDEAVLAAALVAAYYSSSRQSSNVAVDYTEARNVRKPRGAAPGRVIYDSHRTVFVTPSREVMLAALK